MQSVTVNWKGKTFQFKPEFELFEEIEHRVSLTRIFNLMSRGGVGNTTDLPLSHVSWVFFCCLRRAGAPVLDPMEVQHAISSEEFSGTEAGTLIGKLMVAFWGPGSQRQPKKKPTPVKRQTQKSSSPSENT